MRYAKSIRPRTGAILGIKSSPTDFPWHFPSCHPFHATEGARHDFDRDRAVHRREGARPRRCPPTGSPPPPFRWARRPGRSSPTAAPRWPSWASATSACRSWSPPGGGVPADRRRLRPREGEGAPAGTFARFRRRRRGLGWAGDDITWEGRAQFSTDPCILVAADVILVAVPTPLRDGTPDLSLVRDRHGGRGPRPPSRPAGGPRIHHLPGNDRRGRAAHPRGDRSRGRPRLRPRLFARADQPR